MAVYIVINCTDDLCAEHMRARANRILYGVEENSTTLHNNYIYYHRLCIPSGYHRDRSA